MAYTDDILGCIEQVRDIANTGNSPAQSAVVPRTEYGLIKHLRDILDPTSSADAVHPDSIYGFLTQIRDALNVGNSPAFKATYTNDVHGLLIQIRDLVNRADTSAANYPNDELGLWRAIRDFSLTQGFGVGVSTPAPIPPDDPLPPGEDIPDVPGNFDLGPFTVDVDGAVKLGGKKKNNGSVAKFLHNIQDTLPITANKTYTMYYDPDWSGMSHVGSLTMVGFVFKAGNDFYLIGLRGDGSTGVHGYQVSGDGLWNANTGFVVSDEGAVTHGTRDGPNWVQLEVSVNGALMTLRTSADGLSWADEFTDAPTPFADITQVNQWGPGAFFNAEDFGSYHIDVQVWASADASLDTARNPARANLVLSGTAPTVQVPSIAQSITIAKNTVDSASSNFNFTNLTFDTEDVDIDGLHTLSPDVNSRLVIPSALNGKYGVIHASIELKNVTSARVGGLILRNAATYVGTGMALMDNAGNAGAFYIVETQPTLLATGDYFEIQLHCSDTATVLEADSSAFSLYVVG